MRCIIGFVLFVVLYFGSCNFLGEVVKMQALANDPAQSQRRALKVRHEFLRKWHAAIAVGAGVAAIGACALPTILMRMNERAESERLAAMQRGEWR